MCPNSYILLMGGPRDFWGLKFWSKGIFLSMIDAEFFGVAKKTQGFFWVLYFSSAQINNNINTIYCWCGIFLGMLITLGFFWETNSEVGIFWVSCADLGEETKGPQSTLFWRILQTIYKKNTEMSVQMPFSGPLFPELGS